MSKTPKQIEAEEKLKKADAGNKQKDTETEAKKVDIDKIVEERVKEALDKKDAEAETKKQIKKEEVEKSLEVSDYERFAEFYFLSLDEGNRLKADAKKELEKLAVKVKSRKGHTLLERLGEGKTVAMGLGNGVVRLAVGYPVPEAIYQKFVDKGIEGKYFED